MPSLWGSLTGAIKLRIPTPKPKKPVVPAAQIKLGLISFIIIQAKADPSETANAAMTPKRVQYNPHPAGLLHLSAPIPDNKERENTPHAIQREGDWNMLKVGT